MGRDDGFIAHLELAVFAAVLFTLLGVIVETVAVVHTRSELWRDTTLVARITADNHTAAEFLTYGEDTTVDVSVDDGPCPQVRVAAERRYDGVVSGRTYLLHVTVTYPVTLYRTFSPTEVSGDPC